MTDYINSLDFSFFFLEKLMPFSFYSQKNDVAVRPVRAARM